MSTVKFLRECNPKSSIRPVCSFCGERQAIAFWHGKHEVFTCQVCAMEVLPALAADAIINDDIHNNSLRQVNDALVKLEKSFWRACFLAALRAFKK